jgi:uncharacterized protein
MQADIDAGVALCRAQCEYFSVCGGGEPINKLTENGSFASTETVYCRVTKMRATDLVLDALERMSPAEPEPEPEPATASHRAVPGEGPTAAATFCEATPSIRRRG